MSVDIDIKNHEQTTYSLNTYNKVNIINIMCSIGSVTYCCYHGLDFKTSRSELRMNNSHVSHPSL